MRGSCVKGVILLTALAAMVMGWVMRGHEGIAMMLTASGELIYPRSSGSEDAALLAMGLMSFVITLVYASLSVARGHRVAPLLYTYGANFSLFCLCLVLVMVDSDLVHAARIGDAIPLYASLVPFLPLVAFPLCWLVGDKSVTRNV